MTPPTSSGFGTTMRTSRKSYSRKTLTHVSPGSMISSSTSDSDNSLHSLYFTSYHGLINYPQKIPAHGELEGRAAGNDFALVERQSCSRGEGDLRLARQARAVARA